MENEQRAELMSAQKEITLAQLFAVLKKAIVWMLIAALIFGAVAVMYTKLFTHTTYSASMRFVVRNDALNSSYTNSGLTAAQKDIARNCSAIVTEDITLYPIAENAALADKLSVEDAKAAVRLMRTMVKSSVTSSTSEDFTFTVRVSGASAYRVAVIAEALNDHIPTVFTDYEGKEGVRIDACSHTDSISIGSSTPSAMKNAILAALVAAVVVYIVFLILELLDKVVRTEDDVKKNFTSPVIGSIPVWLSEGQRQTGRRLPFVRRRHEEELRDYQSRLLSAQTPFAVKEAFSLLRTNLIYSNPGVNTCPVYAITSDYSGVGKSVVAANLAISLSQVGKRVLLVESDMRRPCFQQLFGRDKIAAQGLSELLTGLAIDWQQVVTHTEYEGLDVIGSGRIPPHPTELLAGATMRTLLSVFREHYDIILLDMPPVCAVTDATVMSDAIDGYLLVARYRVSEVSSLSEAIARISVAQHSTVTGFILNGDERESADYGRRYGRYDVGGAPVDGAHS